MMHTLLVIIVLAFSAGTAYAQPQAEMGSTSAVTLQYDNASYATRNADAVMTTGSKYAPQEESPVDNQDQQTTGRPGRPRRVNGFPDIPFPDPIGDAMWPLMLLACAFICIRAFRIHRAARKIKD